MNNRHIKKLFDEAALSCKESFPDASIIVTGNNQKAKCSLEAGYEASFLSFLKKVLEVEVVKV